MLAHLSRGAVEVSDETPRALATRSGERPLTGTVLVVGEAHSMRPAFEAAFADRSARPHWVDGVEEALMEVSSKCPLALLTRLHLPGLPGTSLIAAMKHSPRHRAVPIGVVTSDPVAAEELLGTLRPDRIVKTSPDIVENLRAFLDAMGIEVSTESRDDRIRLDGRILLAEDTKALQKLVGSILEGAGAEVVIVANGLEAIAAATDERFDLILMDLEMPKMDGRMATRTLRSMGVEVPIIAFTADESSDLRDRVAELGFNDVIGKIISRGPFVEFVAKFMNKSDIPDS